MNNNQLLNKKKGKENESSKLNTIIIDIEKSKFSNKDSIVGIRNKKEHKNSNKNKKSVENHYTQILKKQSEFKQEELHSNIDKISKKDTEKITTQEPSLENHKNQQNLIIPNSKENLDEQLKDKTDKDLLTFYFYFHPLEKEKNFNVIIKFFDRKENQINSFEMNSLNILNSIWTITIPFDYIPENEYHYKYFVKFLFTYESDLIHRRKDRMLNVIFDTPYSIKSFYYSTSINNEKPILFYFNYFFENKEYDKILKLKDFYRCHNFEDWPDDLIYQLILKLKIDKICDEEMLQLLRVINCYNNGNIYKTEFLNDLLISLYDNSFFDREITWQLGNSIRRTICLLCKNSQTIYKIYLTKLYEILPKNFVFDSKSLVFPENFNFQKLFNLINKSFNNGNNYLSYKQLDKDILHQVFSTFDFSKEDLENYEKLIVCLKSLNINELKYLIKNDIFRTEDLFQLKNKLLKIIHSKSSFMSKDDICNLIFEKLNSRIDNIEFLSEFIIVFEKEMIVFNDKILKFLVENKNLCKINRISLIDIFNEFFDFYKEEKNILIEVSQLLCYFFEVSLKNNSIIEKIILFENIYSDILKKYAHSEDDMNAINQAANKIIKIYEEDLDSIHNDMILNLRLILLYIEEDFHFDFIFNIFKKHIDKNQDILSLIQTFMKIHELVEENKYEIKITDYTKNYNQYISLENKLKIFIDFVIAKVNDYVIDLKFLIENEEFVKIIFTSNAINNLDIIKEIKEKVLDLLSKFMSLKIDIETVSYIFEKDQEGNNFKIVPNYRKIIFDLFLLENKESVNDDLFNKISSNYNFFYSKLEKLSNYISILEKFRIENFELRNELESFKRKKSEILIYSVNEDLIWEKFSCLFQNLESVHILSKCRIFINLFDYYSYQLENIGRSLEETLNLIEKKVIPCILDFIKRLIEGKLKEIKKSEIKILLNNVDIADLLNFDECLTLIFPQNSEIFLKSFSPNIVKTFKNVKKIIYNKLSLYCKYQSFKSKIFNEYRLLKIIEKFDNYNDITKMVIQYYNFFIKCESKDSENQDEIQNNLAEKKIEEINFEFILEMLEEIESYLNTNEENVNIKIDEKLIFEFSNSIAVLEFFEKFSEENFENLIDALEEDALESNFVIKDIMSVQNLFIDLLKLKSTIKSKQQISYNSLKGKIIFKLQQYDIKIPNLSDKLKNTHENISIIRTKLEANLNKSEKTLEQITKILKNGTLNFYINPNIEECCVTLNFPEHDEKEKNYEELMNLCNKAMLLSFTKKDSETDSVTVKMSDEFKKIMIITGDIKENLTQLYNYGYPYLKNKQFEFKINLDFSINNYENREDKLENTLKLSAFFIEKIKFFLEDFENILKKWKDSLMIFRKEYYYLNFISEKNFYVLNEIFYGNLSQNNLNIFTSMMKFIDPYFSIEKLDLKNLIFNLNSQIDTCLKSNMIINDNDSETFLENLAKGLNKVFSYINQNKFINNKEDILHLPKNKFVKSGEIFILKIQSNEKIPASLLSLYYYQNQIPSAYQILFCSKETSRPEIDIFLTRCFYSKNEILFTILNFQNLSYELNLIFIYIYIYINLSYLHLQWGFGGDWGLGIGDWGPIPNPQSPIPIPNIFI
jgi:hypothetical protein